MKALLSKLPGGPETLVLEDVPEPIAGPGQVRVAVRACGINFPTLIQDLHQQAPPFSPGSELAGVVDSLGEGRAPARRRLPARRRHGREGGRTRRQLLEDSDAMPFDEAAALLMTYALAARTQG
jgi:NADPH2:quinone reductase